MTASAKYALRYIETYVGTEIPKNNFAKLVKFHAYQTLISFVHGKFYLHNDCGKLRNFWNKLFLRWENLAQIHEERFVTTAKVLIFEKMFEIW